MTDKQRLLHKKGFQNKTCCQVHLEKGTFKNEYRSEGVKLKPLIVPKKNDEQLGNSAERKVLIRLSPISHLVSGVKKRNPSKIPVLQKSYFVKNGRSENNQFDSTLSAADRRQKYHQSRLHVAPPGSNFNTLTEESQKKSAILKEFIPWYSPCHVTEFIPAVYTHSKVVLPPIKNGNPGLENRTEATQVKKKCLIGEITHFPALCNLGSKHIKRSVISKVSHLPPILPPPAAPPPSKALSLEQDGN
ncbi:uncharacterized protein NPIL_348341 [Nephila pilipes]|uniref:Uncharacterized protein n=1 Tax=Nephila pilipes TaxID=299642 RepID=A0A8X6Q8J0_NEPPI|nr:uncharacterized protein NPIL_348341 [Nephila pilipes]